jgi:AAA+ superfamily predicted ATPase
VVNAILQLIDNFPQKSVLIAATNQIHMIDEALIRRFEIRLEYTLPQKEALDVYYDKMLAKYPKQYIEITRIYDVSYAEVKNHIYRTVKDNIIKSQEVLEQ